MEGGRGAGAGLRSIATEGSFHMRQQDFWYREGGTQYDGSRSDRADVLSQAPRNASTGFLRRSVRERARSPKHIYCAVHRRAVEVDTECGCPPCKDYRGSSFCAWF